MQHCRDSKITQEFTVPETPQQNGVAERFNPTLVEIGQCLLIQAQLPKKYWVRAYCSQHSQSHRKCKHGSNEGKSLFEIFTGKPARRNHLTVFGSTTDVNKRTIPSLSPIPDQSSQHILVMTNKAQCM